MLVLSGTISFAQRTQSPEYNLDGHKFSWENTYLNPDNIDSMHVDRTTPGGTIFIYSKKIPGMQFLSITDVVNQFTDFDEVDDRMIFFIKDKLINDISKIKIDKSYFIYVETDALSSIEYISEEHKDLTIIRIDLERVIRKPKIYIRGENEFSDYMEN